MLNIYGLGPNNHGINCIDRPEPSSSPTLRSFVTPMTTVYLDFPKAPNRKKNLYKENMKIRKVKEGRRSRRSRRSERSDPGTRQLGPPCWLRFSTSTDIRKHLKHSETVKAVTHDIALKTLILCTIPPRKVMKSLCRTNDEVQRSHWRL